MEFATLIAGFLLGFLANNYFQIVKEKIVIINDQIEDIIKIEVEAVQYWATNSRDDEVRDKRSAAFLSGVFDGCFEFLDQGCPLPTETRKEISALIGQLYQIVTGGDFQTSERKADLQKITEIVSICTRIKAKLRASRRKYYWAH